MSDPLTFDDIDEGAYQIGKKKNRILIALLINFYIAGFIVSVVPEESLLEYIVMITLQLAFYLLVLLWIEYDARQHFYKIHLPMRVALMLFMVIVFPYYLFRVHGLSAFPILGRVFLFFLLLIFTALIGSIPGILLQELVL